MRVLVIDDQEDSALLLYELAKACGWESRFCTISTRAVSIAREWQPHVILLDLAMPGIDGYQLAPLLRAACEDTLSLLVAVSGYRREPEKLFAARIAGHLLKPVRLEQLRQLLESAAALVH